jgi:hypothetical protein
MWRIGWAPNNASKWEMEYNSVFKGLKWQEKPQYLACTILLLPMISNSCCQTTEVLQTATAGALCQTYLQCRKLHSATICLQLHIHHKRHWPISDFFKYKKRHWRNVLKTICLTHNHEQISTSQIKSASNYYA